MGGLAPKSRAPAVVSPTARSDTRTPPGARRGPFSRVHSGCHRTLRYGQRRRSCPGWVGTAFLGFVYVGTAPVSVSVTVRTTWTSVRPPAKTPVTRVEGAAGHRLHGRSRRCRTRRTEIPGIAGPNRRLARTGLSGRRVHRASPGTAAVQAERLGVGGAREPGRSLLEDDGGGAESRGVGKPSPSRSRPLARLRGSEGARVLVGWNGTPWGFRKSGPLPSPVGHRISTFTLVSPAAKTQERS